MDGSANSTSLATYLGVLRRRLGLVVFVVAVVTAVAVALSLNQQKLYQASTRVLISDQTPQDLVGASTSQPPVDPTRRANTEIVVAEVPTIAQRTLAAIGLRDRSAQQLLSNTSITAASDADVLTVAVTDPSAALAARLANTYTEEFIRYQQQLDTASVRAALHGVEARIKNLEAEISTGGTTDPARADQLRLLLGSQQTLETQARLQGGKLFVIKGASGAEQVQPKLTRNALAGVGVGLILAMGLAFLVHALDTRIRTADEASDALGLSLLGRLPPPPRRLRRQDRLAMLDSAARGHVEAYQKLRTSVDLANLRAGAKTIMITSAVASEGKSTTAANLAVALARAGRRVALVDLDLRDPYIAALFQIDGQPGVTGVATGAVPIQEAVVRAPVRPGTGAAREGLDAGSGLDVLPSGVTPADPAAFLTANVLGAIVHHLRDAYDIVVVDSPPALPVGDAMTLTRVVDAVIVVVRAGVVRRPSLVELRRLLDAAPCEKLGFVLTGADATVNYTYGRRPYAAQDPTRTREIPTSARH